MTSTSDASSISGEPPEHPEPGEPGWFRRIPLWVRIAVPVVVLVGGAGVVAGILASGSSDPATADSLCRAAATSRLEQRGNTDIRLADSLEQSEADGAQRVSGTVTYVDEEGVARNARVRCVIRGEDGDLTVASVRFSS
jgi:hypothetical protein